MGALFKFLLIVFVILYLIGFVFRWFLKKFIRSAQEGYYGTQSSSQAQSQSRQQGDVRIDYVPPKKKGKHFKGGDYVDYEELGK
jgi:hypothetical protein